jgi:hypothetical protein
LQNPYNRNTGCPSKASVTALRPVSGRFVAFFRLSCAG